MTPSRLDSAPDGRAERAPGQLAKGALRRLAAARLEPTPENYARAYRLEAGDDTSSAALPERAARLVERLARRAFDDEASALELGAALGQGRWDDAERALDVAPGADAGALAELIEQVVRGIERGSKAWTAARRKDSLQHVLRSGRSDPRRLRQRLAHLVASWQGDAAEEGDAAAPAERQGPSPAGAGDGALWGRAVVALSASVQQALPPGPGSPPGLGIALAALTQRLLDEGASAALLDRLDDLCDPVQAVLQQRHRLLDDLGELCRELTAGLGDLAENDSWARAQCDAMRASMADGLTVRGVRAVRELLHVTREQQGGLRGDRDRARESLQGLIGRMLAELDQLGAQTGHFHDNVGRYADVIERADSLESLAGAVREMVEESRTVQTLVQQTQKRLHDENAKANGLTQRVSELESEMRRLSDEVTTDQLTQIANRRGMIDAFDALRAEAGRTGGALAIGLLDVDNFKRLNDSLGHAVGDQALRSLAARVSSTLRPTDVVARYGGEEFVVLLPETPVDDAQQILTRLQRSLTGGLFMYQQQQVFVTFSAGVTACGVDEQLEAALERADRALYQAKRSGKNRTVTA